MDFTNLPVIPDTLPDYSRVNLTKPDPAYLSVSLINQGLFFLIMLAGLFGIFILSEAWQVVFLRFGLPGVWLFLLILTLILTVKSYHIRGYALREHDLIYRRGVIFRHVVTIPFNRIQHCEITEGPVERAFGLKTLQVYTAGGQSSDLNIPGLRGQTAQKLKDFILKNKVAEDDGSESG